jgi:N-succinyldiaminopimelate aminotransferase
MKPFNSVLTEYQTSVFETMSRLAIEHKSVNLGQGFPDEEGPDAVKRMLDEATRTQPNQYPPMMGVPELRQAVAAHDRAFYGLELDWSREVLVGSGATEVLAACILALVEPGDQVVLFEPLYDSYLPMLRRAGAIPRLVRLEPPHWEIPRERLAAAFGPKTKLILFNTPMNPTGKVFSREELSFIAGLLEEHDAYAVCDEVYEHLVFDGRAHLPLIALPGMRARCVKIGSAGKTFSMTGWKVGYASGDARLISIVAKAHQFLVFTTPPNLQRAVAWGLANEAPWYTSLAGELQKKRDFLAAGLARIGFGVLDCASTYFLNADIRPFGSNLDDVAFCKMLTVEAGVTLVPVSALYAGPGVDHLVRFCFCKKDATLDGALERLEKRLR